MSVLTLGTVLASHPEVSLSGSDFEIDTDANLKVDDPAPSEDWAAIAQGSGAGQERRAQDLGSGSGDNSFGQGSKEDTAVPTVVDGSIPNNKSDLKSFGAYLEDQGGGQKFLNIFWARVQDPTGTTNMDFEFSKSSTISSNGVTPVRSAGDVLIQYDLTSGGTHPELFLSRWLTSGAGSLCEASNSTPCWSDRINLSAAGDATGSINTSPIPAGEADGLGSLSARTFGEAQIDFDVFAGSGTGGCTGFGSAYLKSRSSDSFTAALKDFIAPVALNFNDCGAIKITKTKKHAASTPSTQPHAGVTFTLSGNGIPAGTTAVTDVNGVACFDSVPINANAYTVTETVPASYVSDDAVKEVTVDNAASCSAATYAGESLTFVNTPLTDITVSVNSQIDGGTDSTIECAFTATDPDLDTPDATGDGTLTKTDLAPGTYTCTIVVDP